MDSVTSKTFELWRWSFFSKCTKFYVDFGDAKSNWENIFSFGDDNVWSCRRNSTLLAEFTSVWDPWTRWFRKDVMKRKLSCIEVSMFFIICNFQIIWAIKLIVFFKMHKILYRFCKCKKKLAEIVLVLVIMTFETAGGT